MQLPGFETEYPPLALISLLHRNHPIDVLNVRLENSILFCDQGWSAVNHKLFDSLIKKYRGGDRFLFADLVNPSANF